MSLPAREEILSEIRRTAHVNGGKPLGIARFEQETGITRYSWGRYWSRFSDAQREAGLPPNSLTAAYGAPMMIERYVALIRELGHVPTKGELQVKNTYDRSFPNPATYVRLGSKNDLLRLVLDHCGDRAEYADVAKLCSAAYRNPQTEDNGGGELAVPGEAIEPASRAGFVYLIRGRRNEYKLGHTSVVDRRLSELATGSSVELEVVHEIKTDDPLGVEAYWHRRFAHSRMKNEWFKLSAADVRAFKRWRRIF